MMQQLASLMDEASEQIADDELARVAMASAAEYADRLRDAYQRRRQVAVDIDRFTRRLSKLNDVLRELNRETVELPLDDEPSTLIGTPGNRSETMPARRPEFAQLRLADAVDIILADRDRLHADNLVRLIFDIGDRRQLTTAKRSLVSTLAQGAKQGRYIRVAPNTYSIGYETGPTAGSNGIGPSSRSVQNE
jgi:hypothetical protein